MTTLLHLITRPDDALAREIIEKQQKLGSLQVECVDLSAGAVDYRELVQRIFAADSVQVW